MHLCAQYSVTSPQSPRQLFPRDCPLEQKLSGHSNTHVRTWMPIVARLEHNYSADFRIVVGMRVKLPPGLLWNSWILEGPMDILQTIVTDGFAVDIRNAFSWEQYTAHSTDDHSQLCQYVCFEYRSSKSFRLPAYSPCFSPSRYMLGTCVCSTVDLGTENRCVLC